MRTGEYKEANTEVLLKVQLPIFQLVVLHYGAGYRATIFQPGGLLCVMEPAIWCSKASVVILGIASCGLSHLRLPNLAECLRLCLETLVSFPLFFHSFFLFFYSLLKREKIYLQLVVRSFRFLIDTSYLYLRIFFINLSVPAYFGLALI